MLLLLVAALLAQTTGDGRSERPPAGVQAGTPGPDVVKLLDGDRVTGRIVGATTRRVRVQTAYGTLVIPRDRVLQLERDGGVEVINAPPAPPTPIPPPPPEPTHINLAVSGDTFWRAWDPKAIPADASLRLAFHLDDADLVSYTDATLDPEDLPKAAVNSFVFSAEQLTVQVAAGVVAAPVLIADGEIGLALKIPGEWAGPHRLRLAYQVNEGTLAVPRWHDVVAAETTIVLRAGGTVRLRVRQNRGSMQYTRRKMRDAETFTVAIREDGEGLEGTASPPSP